MSILGFLEIGEIGINGYRHQCSVLKQELILFYFFFLYWKAARKKLLDSLFAFSLNKTFFKTGTGGI